MQLQMPKEFLSIALASQNVVDERKFAYQYLQRLETGIDTCSKLSVVSCISLRPVKKLSRGM